MTVCFVTEGGINEFWDNLKEVKADVICFGFNGLGDVNYKEEIDGDTNHFEDLALLSKELACVAMSGCITDTYGVKRLSVVVAEKGRILGVSDRINNINNSPYECGSAMRVYDTSCGKIGIIVDTDIFFPENIKVLSMSESDVIFSIFGELTDTTAQIVMRSMSYTSGISICMCALGYTQISDRRGKVVYATPEKINTYDLKIKKDFNIIESRQRGIFRETFTSF